MAVRIAEGGENRNVKVKTPFRDKWEASLNDDVRTVMQSWYYAGVGAIFSRTLRSCRVPST